MKKVKDTEYVFITPYVRAREAKLLGWEQVQRMLEAPGAQEAAAIAAEYGYEGLEAITAESLEQSLNARRAAAFGDLRKLMPQQAVVDAFCLRYDYHNAKVLIKAAAAGQNGTRLLSGAGRVPAAQLAECFSQKDGSALPPALAEAMEAASEVLARTGDPQLADVLLDQAWLAEMASLAEKAGSQFLLGYTRLTADSVNLRTALRVRRMGKDAQFLSRLLVPGGNVAPESIIKAAREERPLAPLFSGPLAQAAEAGEKALAEKAPLGGFEGLCDKALEAYLGGANLIAFGEQPVISYICAVEAEIGRVRSVLAGRLAALPAAEIQERLREKNG